MNGFAVYAYIHFTFSIYLVYWFTGLLVPCRLPAWKVVLWSAFLALGGLPKLYFGVLSSVALLFDLIMFVLWAGSLFVLYEGKIWKRIAGWRRTSLLRKKRPTVLSPW